MHPKVTNVKKHGLNMAVMFFINLKTTNVNHSLFGLMMISMNILKNIMLRSQIYTIWVIQEMVVCFVGSEFTLKFQNPIVIKN